MPRTFPEASAVKKLFVLDTNVLLHDPFCLLRFESNDVFIPFVTLEELDNKKTGALDVNRNARQATRLIGDVVVHPSGGMDKGFPLETISGNPASGNLYVQTKALPFLENEHLHKNDNMYLSVLDYLGQQKEWAAVTLVTKDINLRVKAMAVGFDAQDYRHDHEVSDIDLVYRGMRRLELDTYEKLMSGEIRSWKEDGRNHYETEALDLRMNEFLVFPTEREELYRVIELLPEVNRAILRSVEDTSQAKRAVVGITAMNEEQVAALNLLHDPDIDLVALMGTAGTGKTLLTMAAGLNQVLSTKSGGKEQLYDEILYTRATVPLGEDIGALPGNEAEKMAPWLGALEDSLEVICENVADSVTAQHEFREKARDVVKSRAMTFMRGRTFHRKFVIIDEFQNLTPKQVKALITRAGAGTKVVCMGNLSQIDSPYLSETSSGLTYLVERFKGWRHFGSLVLEKGERSRLATEGNVRL